ncbi:MAG: hypothetical protein ACP5JJ_03265, partial [Anaerolineae bacterium]
DADDAIFVSDDHGATWHSIFSLNDLPIWYRHIIIDLDQAVGDLGLTFTGDFLIKFQSYDYDPFDGFVIDEVQLRSTPVVTPASFPYYNGFESGALGDEWQIEFTNEGRVAVDDTYPYAGTYSLLLDDYRDDSTKSIAAAILTVDLAGQTDVVLDFWGRELGGYADADDAIFVSDDHGATWHSVFSLNDLTSSYSQVIIDLDQAVGDLGLTFTDDFLIKFQSYDYDPFDGFVIDELRLRRNIAPTLFWCGDAGYEADGLEPESGHQLTDFVYRISYADPDGDPPARVSVHIKKGGTEIAGSPFSMGCSDGDYAQGVVCTHDQKDFEEGDDYAYFFSAEDDQGNLAPATAELEGPVVINVFWGYLPLVLKNAGPPASPPELYPIDNPDGDYRFMVSWSEVERATRYTLEEDTDPGFADPRTVYSGPSTSREVKAVEKGTYYYRVKAANSFGSTGWSNVESVVVSTEPPCPQAGSWSGRTDQGYMIGFTVANTPRCEVTYLEITVYLRCLLGGGMLYTRYYRDPEPIVASEFQYGSGNERVSGIFISETQAEGSAYFQIPDPRNPAWFCYGLTDWTASHNP